MSAMRPLPIKEHPIIKEEFAADDEEEDDAGGDVRDVAREAESLCDLAGALLQEFDQEARQDHHEGIELREPGDQHGGKAVAACQRAGNGVCTACHQQEAGEAGKAAGERGGTDNDLSDIDADVAGGILALTHDGDLIAVFAVLKIDVHEYGQEGNNDDVQRIFLAEERGQPAAVALAVHNAQDPGTARDPDRDHGIDELDRHVVHHQGEQCLIGAETGFEKGRDTGPDDPGDQRCREHQKNEHAAREPVADVEHQGTA